MSDRKYLDVGEFQRLGFLQEANRLFFHLHGLALEITMVDEEGWSEESSFVLRIADAIHEAEETGPNARSYRALAREIADRLHPPGSVFLSGVWDVRDDPEGVVMGSWSEEQVDRAHAVAEERAHHTVARAEMFGAEQDDADADVEPFTFRWKPAA